MTTLQEFRFSAKARQALAAWPRGIERRHNTNHGRNETSMGWGALHRAVDLGLLRKSPWDERTFVRTDLPAPAYAPRSEAAKQRAYRSEHFPWSSATHFKRLASDPKRIAFTAAQLLEGVKVNLDAYRYPQCEYIIATQAHLTQARAWLTGDGYVGPSIDSFTHRLGAWGHSLLLADLHLERKPDGAPGPLYRAVDPHVAAARFRAHFVIPPLP